MKEQITHDDEGRYTISFPPPDGWEGVVAKDTYRRAHKQVAHIFSQKVRAFVDGWWDAGFETPAGFPSSRRAGYNEGYKAYSPEKDSIEGLEKALLDEFGPKGTGKEKTDDR